MSHGAPQFNRPHAGRGELLHALVGAAERRVVRGDEQQLSPLLHGGAQMVVEGHLEADGDPESDRTRVHDTRPGTCREVGSNQVHGSRDRSEEGPVGDVLGKGTGRCLSYRPLARPVGPHTSVDLDSFGEGSVKTAPTTSGTPTASMEGLGAVVPGGTDRSLATVSRP